MMSLARFGPDPQMGGRLARRWLSGQIPGHRRHANVLVRRWPLPLVVAITIVAQYAPFIGVGHRDLLGLLGGYARDGLRDGSGIWLLAGLSNLVRLSRSCVGFARVSTVAEVKLMGEPNVRPYSALSARPAAILDPERRMAHW